MNKPVKLFIVEGESRDYRFVSEMAGCFFKGRYASTVINLPASQNLYMLYQKLREDNFETDVIEILRDCVEDARIKLNGIKRQEIDEIYLFFDYDVHQNNTSDGDDVLLKMFRTFNNETENGKLYISYPMVEALYDYREGECEAFSKCFVPVNYAERYKTFSGTNNPQASHRMTIQRWRTILNVFSLKMQCLWDNDDLSYSWYKNHVDPEKIYAIELGFVKKQRSIFVLSAFPEFLFDYFKEDFWNSMTHRKRRKFSDCPKLLKDCE